MRKVIQSAGIFFLFATVMFLMSSCNKEMSASGSTSSSTNTTPTTSTSSTIAVTLDSTGMDSVYILQQCSSGYFRDSIAASALPDSILNYLANSYPGNSFRSAYVIKDSAGTVGGYVVVISFNDKPVGLLFDAAGNFQRVLEQREHGDINGRGWHHGGRFQDRDGDQRDSIALAALPGAVNTYMTSNYPSDTLIRAYRNSDSSILVISKNNGLFANLFTSAGVFVKRVALAPQEFLFSQPVAQNIAQDSLPSNVLSYLLTTYPNYVFETASSIWTAGQLRGYAVVIDANNTKYAVWFDVTGKMGAAVILW